jgi:hypothetical protein
MNFPVLEKPVPLTMRNAPNHVNRENNIMTIIPIAHVFRSVAADFLCTSSSQNGSPFLGDVLRLQAADVPDRQAAAL